MCAWSPRGASTDAAQAASLIMSCDTLLYDVVVYYVVLQPLTIKYCQNDLRIFLVNLVAAIRYVHSFTNQTPHSSCHGEAENHFPRSATQNKQNRF